MVRLHKQLINLSSPLHTALAHHSYQCFMFHLWNRQKLNLDFLSCLIVFIYENGIKCRSVSLLFSYAASARKPPTFSTKIIEHFLNFLVPVICRYLYHSDVPLVTEEDFLNFLQYFPGVMSKWWKFDFFIWKVVLCNISLLFLPSHFFVEGGGNSQKRYCSVQCTVHHPPPPPSFWKSYVSHEYGTTGTGF